jgi:hypothetical protein
MQLTAPLSDMPEQRDWESQNAEGGVEGSSLEGEFSFFSNIRQPISGRCRPSSPISRSWANEGRSAKNGEGPIFLKPTGQDRAT